MFGVCFTLPADLISLWRYCAHLIHKTIKSQNQNTEEESWEGGEGTMIFFSKNVSGVLKYKENIKGGGGSGVGPPPPPTQGWSYPPPPPQRRSKNNRTPLKDMT